MEPLEIYILNVGQADTTIIKTPNGRLIVIDAVKPNKVQEILEALSPGPVQINYLVLTHPHWDHYSGVSALLRDCVIDQVTLPPFWFIPGTPGYHQIINRIHEKQIPVQFLSGYSRLYPDGGTYPAYENQPYLEFLGPPNHMMEELYENGVLIPNHLSIMTRLVYDKFSMVLAADAQMENWAHYDQQGMLDQGCDVLRAAHHGSRNGVQWERLDRLSPRLVIVSSDYEASHHLPDVIGSVIFLEYDADEGRTVVLTRDTGTIKIAVDQPEQGRFEAVGYGEGPKDTVFDRPEVALSQTDWAAVAAHKLAHSGEGH